LLHAHHALLAALLSEGIGSCHFGVVQLSVVVSVEFLHKALAHLPVATPADTTAAARSAESTATLLSGLPGLLGIAALSVVEDAIAVAVEALHRLLPATTALSPAAPLARAMTLATASEPLTAIG